MKVGWESLPILPLRCVLDHLTTKDAMAVLSVCRNWRNAILVYEGHRDLLELQANELEKNLFLARIYKKHVRQLHICIDCSDEELDRFFHIVLPEFLDSQKLKEIVFIGPSYLQPDDKLPPTTLNRIVIESLIYKNAHCLTGFAMLGCKMEVAKNNDRYMHEQIQYYSEPLTWNSLPSPSDSVLSSSNTGLMLYSTLQSISVDYDQISTEALETLSHLPLFSGLTLNITSKHESNLQPIDWERLAPCYPNGVDVSVNIIGFSATMFDELIENVFVEGLTLVSLKVFFCRILHCRMISHVVRLYKSFLRCVVWVDAPHTPRASPALAPRPTSIIRQQIDACNINPLILLCWQCVNLRKLVVHGYWIWQYDVLGFVRLRKTLEHLEISAVFNKQRRWGEVLPDTMIRVCTTDQPATTDNALLQEMNEFLESPWSPTPWSELHPALTTRGTPQDRAQYVLQEIAHSVDSM